MGRPPQPNPSWDANRPDPGTSYTAYKIYNIGNNQPVELTDFIAAIEAAVGKKARKEMREMQAGDVPATYADIDDLVRDVGFRPDTPLEIGIRRFVDWFRDYYNY
jgi:UDP-glucuronate 4-epimerase